MKNIFLIFILIMLVPAANAASLGIFMQGLDADLSLPCTNETTICTFCNITTIKSPINSSILISNVVMSQRNSEFNYTLIRNYTSTIGTYLVSGLCGDGSQISTWNYDFKITPNGSELSVSQGILYLVFLIAAIGLFILCLTYAIKIPWRHQRDEEGYVIGINDMRYLKLFLIVACYIILMFSAGLLRGITANYLPEIGVSGFFEWVFWIMLSLMYPLIVCSLIFSLIIFLSNKKFQKAIEKGLPIE